MQPKKPPEELYDLKNDPHELHNLATSPEYAATLKELQGKLQKWRDSVGDKGVTEAFRTGGWAATYPTRPLAQWQAIEKMWSDNILHNGPKVKVPLAPGFASETKAKE
jgi:arylsulfatase A-like enzyme